MCIFRSRIALTRRRRPPAGGYRARETTCHPPSLGGVGAGDAARDTALVSCVLPNRVPAGRQSPPRLLTTPNGPSPSAGLRRGDRGARHPGRGVLQGLYPHHAASPGQPHPLDLRHAGADFAPFECCANPPALMRPQDAGDLPLSYRFRSLYKAFHGDRGAHAPGRCVLHNSRAPLELPRAAATPSRALPRDSCGCAEGRAAPGTGHDRGARGHGSRGDAQGRGDRAAPQCAPHPFSLQESDQAGDMKLEDADA